MPEFTADTRRHGHAPAARGDPHRRLADPLLPGRVVARCSARSPRPRRPRRTPFHPRSPYAIAKVFAHWMTVQYREAYGLHASNGILFNHESPRRGGTFVTRKVTRGVAAILAGKAGAAVPGQPRRPARLGLRARVRRGDVADAPAGPSPTTTSSPPARCTRSASSCEVAFGLVGLDWERHVRIDERYFRPTEVDELCGDASKARARARLARRRSRSHELVRLMLEARPAGGRRSTRPTHARPRACDRDDRTSGRTGG